MKSTKIMTMAFLLFSAFTSFSQTSEIVKIEKVITEFSKAGDASDSEKLATYLDDNYRVVMNRLFGSTEVSVLPKSIYLEKIKSKEFGGDKRELNIESITINGTTATAKVDFKGTKMTFRSLLLLVQGTDGNWKLICDTPVVQ